MCEICAYSCKRKNELRNHMLAKHSGEEKQPCVYKCKYCMYTTCYRQALQNHENCKHTKLKEFRCALCFYSSFSSVSLFLHKKKSHGYIPGDKAWLENYAAKERERNSAEFMQDFYKKPSTDAQSIEKSSPSHGGQSELPGAADDSASKETATGSQTVETVNAFDVVSQEIVNESTSDSPPCVNSPEEYCTLVLTTLSTTDYQTSSFQNTEGQSPNQTPRTASSNASQEKADFSTSTGSSEEDNVAEAHEECEQNNAGDSYDPLNTSASQTIEAGTRQRPEVKSKDKTAAEQNLALESEVRLTAMKKHDKDQAIAMVLGGQVQMLVVPTRDVYHCNKCSYVTCKETALKYHCQSLCQGRIKGHKCQACGAEFKQRRALDSHIAKKCPALPRKQRTFVGVSNTSVATEGSSTQYKEGSKQLAETANSLQTELLSVSTSDLPVCEGSDDNAPTRRESGRQQSTTQKKKLLNVKHVKSVPKKSSYTKQGGKFQCKLCSFSSVKRAAIECHLSTCRRKQMKAENQKLLEVVDEAVREKEDTIQCNMCSFLAKSRRTLTRHIMSFHNKKKLDAAKAKRLHCQHCTFTCRQQRCMTQHVALKHKGTRPYCCRYCPFSTTRHYRVEEHESLHTGIGRHKCDLCDKTFGAVAKLRQHKTRIHDKHPTHFCSLCDFSGYTPDDVRRHNLRCHTGELEHACTHCDARFSSEIALRNHCKRVHQLQVCFSCKHCDYTCSSEATLKTHQQSKHPQLKCSTCQESFETKESLEIHQRTHLAHQCQLCPFAAKTRQRLAQHLLNEHEEGSLDDKPLRCSTCQFACRNQLVLEQHLRSHGGKRVYKCTDCEYSTPNKQKITWHIRIHTGEKPYGCELCSYTCTDPSRLKVSSKFIVICELEPQSADECEVLLASL